METRTITKLADITDEGLFERIATAVLRLTPDYEGLAHTGINPNGKTRKSPLDGLRFLGGRQNRLIGVHHTITAAKRLEGKWLLDPAQVEQRSGTKNEPLPGDVIKSFEIIRAERKAAPGLAATLVLTTNQEPDQVLLRKLAMVGRAEDVTIDIWTRSRLASWLDTDPRGQVIRRKLLGIEEELLSRDLLAHLSTRSIEAFNPGDNRAIRISRALDNTLASARGPVTFVTAPSGAGKTVSAHRALENYRNIGGIALVVPHAAIEQALTLEQAVLATLRQLQPTLSPAESLWAQFSEEDPLLILVEDISRSLQPQRLVEKIASWGPSESSSSRLPWRLLCPVWPHLLGGIQSQFRDRVSTMTLRPQAMSNDEGAAAIQAHAKASGVRLDIETARSLSKMLGDDPLIIALNREWSAPSVELVFERYIREAFARIEQEGGPVAADLRGSLLDLGKAMLARTALDPDWLTIRSWNLRSETMHWISVIARNGEILRLDGSSTAMTLRFRHDRVRDWLLVESALALDGSGLLDNDLIAEPALAEIIGALLVRTKAQASLTERVLEHGALALFQGLRLATDDKETSQRLATAAGKWLRNSDNLGPATKTLRWQAMAAIESVAGDFMVELARLFPNQSPMTMLARLRNGDVSGGVELSARFDLQRVAAWTRGALTAARPSWGAVMAAELGRQIEENTDEDEKRRWALIEFAGMIGDPALAPALQRLWARDEGRANRLAVYLWAMARCATAETAFSLLDPICAAWGALPQERENNMSSPRDNLAASSVCHGFQWAPPLGALDYFIERAREPDLSWQIEYMLHGIDNADTVLFQVERGAERLKKGNSYTFNNQAREHWRHTLEGYGRPMSPETRAPLLDLWRNLDASSERRRAAFDIWATGRGKEDLSILRAVTDDVTLDERILRERLQRGDHLAIPALVRRLDDDDGLRWWFYARYVWSPSLYEALDRALAREAAKPPPSTDRQYDIGSTLTRVLMRLPVIDAEHLLLKYWSHFGQSMHFFQAALYVATPELLSRADTVVRVSSDPAKLFEHVVMHFGIRMGDEVGITRETQIRAIAPYFRWLRPEDLRDFASVCNENGWYALRRHLVDPKRDPDELESPSSFRRRLDAALERGSASFLDHDVDDMLRADVGWPDLAASVREWLTAQTSIVALDIANSAIRHAGDQGDATILSAWRGDDQSLLTATIADLDFALRRRTRSRH